ncbi:hypothetical protein D3C86_1795200 [compost metagenome]
MYGPSHSEASSALTVATKRGSFGSMKLTSAISSTLASSSFPPKLSAKAWRDSLQDSSRICFFMRLAWSCQ